MCAVLGKGRLARHDRMTAMEGPSIPLRRLARPEERGELAAFLGSDESSYLIGTQVVIDGGSTLPESVSVGVQGFTVS